MAFQGVNTLEVGIQVHLAKGIPTFNIVGLPDKTVAESRDRIRAALTSLNLSLPSKRITVNLSPADLCKEGSHYDLPLAVGILILLGSIAAEDVSEFLIMGELALDGSILPVSGVLPAAITAGRLKKGLICPHGNGSEAAIASGVEVVAAKNLFELIEHFCPNSEKKIPTPCKIELNKAQSLPDMKDVKGQFVARRAIEIAAAGGHNLLMVGPPGTGKSMLAKRLIALLPNLTNDEMMEINVIASLLRQFDGSMNVCRPFREPHSSCSVAAMVGGGREVKPGEITLAHRGVLFLDELPEFPRAVLESLRQPLENKNVTLSRANAHITYPANFQLIVAMNPCRCGYFGDINMACGKGERCRIDYQQKISGPLLDRIDIHTEVPYINILSVKSAEPPESTETIRKRVLKARHIQTERYKDISVSCNAELSDEYIRTFIELDIHSIALLEKVMEGNYISARGYARILKVARTIADLCNSPNVYKEHISEALMYRIR